MPKHRADARKADTMPEHGCGCGMPEHVSAAERTVDAGSVQGSPHDALHGDAAEGDDWSYVRQEYAPRRHPWPVLFDVGDDRVAQLLGQRQPLLAPRLAGDGQPALRPVDLIEAQMGDLARAEPEPREQEDDGAITQAITAIARAENAREIGIGQEARRRQPPTGEARDGAIASRRQPAVCDQITQEGARGDGDALGAPATMGLGSIEHEAAHGRRRIGGGSSPSAFKRSVSVG